MKEASEIQREIRIALSAPLVRVGAVHEVKQTTHYGNTGQFTGLTLSWMERDGNSDEVKIMAMELLIPQRTVPMLKQMIAPLIG